MRANVYKAAVLTPRFEVGLLMAGMRYFLSPTFKHACSWLLQDESNNLIFNIGVHGFCVFGIMPQAF